METTKLLKKELIMNYKLNKLEIGWIKAYTCYEKGIISKKTAKLLMNEVIDYIQSDKFLKLTNYCCNPDKCLNCLFHKVKDKKFRSELIDYSLGIDTREYEDMNYINDSYNLNSLSY